MTLPYQPITKETAADILSVSKRTIDNWLADGTIVAPHQIGRRVYWHPAVFYKWLDERLGRPAGEAPCGPLAQRKRGRPRGTLRGAAAN